MKLLMFYVHDWWYKTASKTLETAPDVQKEEAVKDAVAVFFHVEEKDEMDKEGALRKFVKNTKWLSGKFSTKNVVLHSFNHLSSSKSSIPFAEAFIKEAEERLRGAGFGVMTTPFGYFNEFKMHVAGDSLAKVYKEF